MIEHCLPRPGRLEREWVLWVELWLRAVRHPALQDVAHELYLRLHEWFAAVLAEGAARGEFAIADVDATTDVLLAAIDGVGVRVLAGDPALTSTARASSARARVARGRRRGGDAVSQRVGPEAARRGRGGRRAGAGTRA